MAPGQTAGELPHALLCRVYFTLVNWLDSVLYGYYTFAYVFGDAVYRFGVGMLNAVVVATVAIPLAVLLRRQRVVQEVKRP